MSDPVPDPVPVKAVLFDLGETLFTFGRLDANALFKEGARLTYEYLKNAGQRVPPFKRYYFENVLLIRLKYLWSHITGNDFDSSELLVSVGSRLGYKLSSAQWEEIAWLWYEPLSRMAKIETDICQTLSKLREMGLKLGIVSNTFLNQTSLDRHLRDFGMLDYFDLRLYSYEVAWRKPNVKIFKEAADRLGIEPSHIVFVGDRIDNDIRGAQKAGMIPVLKSAYTNVDKKTPPGVIKIEHLSELVGVVRELDQSK